MQRALVIHSGAIVEAQDLLFEPGVMAHHLPIVSTTEELTTLDEAQDSLGDGLRDHERRLILDALEEGHGSRKYVAEKLGISPRTLRYKMAKLKLETSNMAMAG